MSLCSTKWEGVAGWMTCGREAQAREPWSARGMECKPGELTDSKPDELHIDPVT